MHPQILIIFFISLAIVIVVLFVLQARKYYKSLSEISRQLLWPPYLRLLAFLPFLGRRWLKNIQDVSSSIQLSPPAERSFTQFNTINIQPDYILLEEQHNRATGEEVGVRYHFLDNKRAYTLITYPDLEFQPEVSEEIQIQTARSVHEKIIWGYLNFDGQHWVLENLNCFGDIFPILSRSSNNRYELKQYVQKSRALQLETGDRLLIGVSDFYLIDLTHAGQHMKGLAELLQLDDSDQSK